MTNIENLKHKASEAPLLDYNNLGFHELASLMAMIEGKAKEDFKADIKLKGIQNKMMLFEGRLLDGPSSRASIPPSWYRLYQP